MTLLEIYLLGCAAAFVSIMLYECIIDFHWKLSLMSRREWIQDIVCSLLSWLIVPVVIFMFFYAKKHPEMISRDCDKKRKEEV